MDIVTPGIYVCPVDYLPVETDSWLGIERQCSKCDLTEIDQFHYMLMCEFVEADRRKHVPVVNVRYPHTMLFKSIMCELNRKELVHLSKFIPIVSKNSNKPLR